MPVLEEKKNFPEGLPFFRHPGNRGQPLPFPRLGTTLAAARRRRAGSHTPRGLRPLRVHPVEQQPHRAAPVRTVGVMGVDLAGLVVHAVRMAVLMPEAVCMRMAIQVAMYVAVPRLRVRPRRAIPV